MSKKRRRSPRKHQVHPRHPRYKTNEYERGVADLGGGKTGFYEVKDPAEIIAEQFSQLEPYWQSRYSVKSLIKMDENTLRIASKPRGRNQVNMDIKYNAGTDLYDIKAYEIARDMSVYEVYDIDGIYAENLTDVTDRVLFKRDFKRGKLIQEGFKL